MAQWTGYLDNLNTWQSYKPDKSNLTEIMVKILKFTVAKFNIDYHKCTNQEALELCLAEYRNV